MIQNVVDLDSAARRDAFILGLSLDGRSLSFTSECVFSNVVHKDFVSCLPVRVLFDFAMAFPSVSHAWVFLLGVILFLEGIYDAALALYTMNRAYMNTQNGIVFMFVVLSGVLQGGPLSGFCSSYLSTHYCTCSNSSREFSPGRGRACDHRLGHERTHAASHCPNIVF